VGVRRHCRRRQRGAVPSLPVVFGGTNNRMVVAGSKDGHVMTPEESTGQSSGQSWTLMRCALGLRVIADL